MFEDSLIESANQIQSDSKRWSLLTFVLNTAALTAVIIWPLLHPSALRTQVMAPLMVAPTPASQVGPRAAPPVKLQTRFEMHVDEPSHIPSVRKLESAQPPAMEGTMAQNIGGATGSVGSVLDSLEPGPAIIVRQASSKPLPVSSGVMAGNLLVKSLPPYPAIAKAAGIQGTVTLQAVISRAGLIQDIQVTSGPAMLQKAAIDSVRTWRYKPYLLNGEPIEVETTIHVIFSLGR